MRTKSSLRLDQRKLATLYTIMTYVASMYSTVYSTGERASPINKKSSMYGAKAQNAVEAFHQIRRAPCIVHEPRTSEKSAVKVKVDIGRSPSPIWGDFVQ